MSSTNRRRKEVTILDDENAHQQQQGSVNSRTSGRSSKADINNNDEDTAQLLGNGSIAQDGVDQGSWCQRYQKAFVPIFFTFFGGMSSSMLAPMLPGLKKDQLGGDKKAAEIVTIIQCTAAITALFTAPIYGSLIDAWGRRFFFILGACFAVLTVLTLLLFRNYIIVYSIVVSILNTILSSNAYQNAFIADHFDKKRRPVVMAATLCAGNFTAIAAIITAKLSDEIAIILSLSCTGVQLLIAIFFAKESLVNRPSFHCAKEHNPFTSMRLLFKSKVVLGAVGLIGLFMFASVGMGDIMFFYLNERIDFGKQDIGYVYAEFGLMQPFSLLLVLPFALKVLSPIMVLLIAIAALLTEQILLATIWAKWAAYALIVPAYGLTLWLMPIATAIVANSGGTQDQGRRMAGIQAITDVCDALGPLFFGTMYAHVKGPLMVLPFVVCGFMAIPAGVLSLYLQRWIREESQLKRRGSVKEDDGVVVAVVDGGDIAVSPTLLEQREDEP